MLQFNTSLIKLNLSRLSRRQTLVVQGLKQDELIDVDNSKNVAKVLEPLKSNKCLQSLDVIRCEEGSGHEI